MLIFLYHHKIVVLKQNAAKKLGYKYEIWVYDGKGNRVKEYL